MTNTKININITGTDDDETVNVNDYDFSFTGPNDLFLKFEGNNGNDRMKFSLADYKTKIGTVYGSFSGGAGVDTLELDLATATRITSSVSTDGTVKYSFFKDDGATSLKGGFVADSSVERLVIKGSVGADTFHGGSGNDWFDGRGGGDTYFGSAGDDGYVFYSSSDKVVGEVAGGGIDTIWTSVTVDLREQGFVENLRLTGDSAINGTGNDLANLITGNAAANVIAGGKGNDSLKGGGGADTFYFAEAGAANRDSIADFSSDDRILLSGDTFRNLIVNSDGSVASASFSTNVAKGSAAQLIYNQNTGILSYDADGTGAQAAQDIAFVGKKLAFFDNNDIFITQNSMMPV